MKKLLLLAFAMFSATLSFAQLQLATLDHNGNISVYYGTEALIQAHNAAEAGDIITLSSGSFNTTTITKAVTIRGAGMFLDTAIGTDPTILLDNFTIAIEDDGTHHLYMEGLYCTGSYISYSKIYNPQFVKCYFREIDYTDQRTMENASFINCIINGFRNGNSSNPYARNTQFINSVILDLSYNGHYGDPTLTNCIAKLFPGYTNQVTILNSIVYSGSYTTSINAHTSFCSIGIYTSGNSRDYFNATGLTYRNLHNYHSFEEVFKNFRGSYGEGITFELQDSIAANCLGSDGTQVGIFGGVMPFNPYVHNTLIGKLTVGRRTNDEGKLEVNVEILDE